MRVVVNGSPREVAGEPSLADLVSQVSKAETGIAVAVNAAVVPRGSWAETAVREGDRIEVVTAVQGG